MKDLTFCQITLFNDCLKTPIIYLHLNFMHVLINIQTALPTECLITYFTGIIVLTTVYVFMLYQTTPPTLCLITYFTATPAFSTIHALMCC